ncbi:MAG: YdcF family protein [Cyclobacteriaceae bacterium]
MTIIIILLLWGLLTKKRKLLWAGMILLLFFSNSFIANEVFLLWELPPTPIKEIDAQYDLGIVLTGITNTQKTPHDRVYFNKGADRATHAIQLYHQGIIKKILLSGGSSTLIDNQLKEADNLAMVLQTCGIPDEDILIENQGRNTYESAVNCATLIQKQTKDPSVVLITSAFHMRRASACFEKVGLEVDQFSADFYTYDRKFTPDAWLLPSTGAIHKWGIIIKEWVGIVAYKVSGYI